MKIIQDTREQTPYIFRGYDTIIKKLLVADYSIQGMDNRIVIERKSLADAYGTIGKGRERFVKQLAIMSDYEYSAIVIESGISDFILYPESFNKALLKRCKANLTLDYDKLKMKMSPKAAVNSLFAWSICYGVHVFWCDNREYGQATTLRLLEKFYKYKG